MSLAYTPNKIEKTYKSGYLTVSVDEREDIQLSNSSETSDSANDKIDVSNNKGKIGQEQIHGLLFGDKLSWQAIIYDLINAEQLDPWDIDISLLSNKFLEKVKVLEEANFFVSSKVLFAAALLLRIKSEILLNEDLVSLDEALFGKKEEGKKYVQERIELDDEIPELVVRTPLPRFKKVSLEELMSALGKAIQTETRRIKRVLVARQYEIEAGIALPRHRINIGDKIKEIYEKLKDVFTSREHRLAFSELAGEKSEEKVSTFVPLLHLENQHKIVLDQEGHLQEIWIWLKSLHDKHFAEELERMRKEVEAELIKEETELNPEERERAEKIENEFANPLEGIEGKDNREIHEEE